ncbi:hypothetical protein ACFFJI_00485 [Allobacillus sp. GCM10007491]|uniref:Uncharacterized protein n=1 Tax=Allobacillus saliphilus TaxID=2912308 RepID=A0A941HTG9_9BACI|nr:hypothetical protein [Allobacillus saliphilus]MBR7553780.1 hypothetical protein [Allobacillus saliphilus]
MGNRLVISSAVACLMTWSVVLLVFLNMNGEVIHSSLFNETAETNMMKKEYVTLIESESVVTAQVQDESTTNKTIDQYKEKQQFTDGVPIDELLHWLEIEQEAVPSS